MPSGTPGLASLEVREDAIGLFGEGAIGQELERPDVPAPRIVDVEHYAPVKREEGADINGSLKSYLAMANAYYDLKTAWLGPFKPYVGFGVGAARVHEDRDGTLTLQVGSLPPGSKVQIDEWRTAFAYQARVGVGYDVNTWLGLSAGYRFINIDGGHRDGIFPGVTVHSGTVRNHSLEFGAAFKF